MAFGLNSSYIDTASYHHECHWFANHRSVTRFLETSYAQAIAIRRIDRSIREVFSPLDAFRYACHPRPVNGYPISNKDRRWRGAWPEDERSFLGERRRDPTGHTLGDAGVHASQLSQSPNPQTLTRGFSLPATNRMYRVCNFLNAPIQESARLLATSHFLS
jgi:hypothetical protein